MLPACDFVAVDMKAEAIEILRYRAADAGIGNVSAVEGRIEDYRCCSYCMYTKVSLPYSSFRVLSTRAHRV